MLRTGRTLALAVLSWLLLATSPEAVMADDGCWMTGHFGVFVIEGVGTFHNCDVCFQEECYEFVCDDGFGIYCHIVE